MLADLTKEIKDSWNNEEFEIYLDKYFSDENHFRGRYGVFLNGVDRSLMQRLV